MAIPGNNVSNGESNKWFLPSLNIVPQLGSGGCTPRPKKLREASASKMAAKLKLACTSKVGTILGKMCRSNMRPEEAPMLLDACTKSNSRSLSVKARANLAYVTHPSITKAMITFFKLGPRTAMIAIASRMPGKAKRISAGRMINSSIQPPAQPEMDPNATPIVNETQTTVRDTKNETLPPYRRRDKTSRPSSSVPSQWDAHGGKSRSER